jgi:predicted enzyme related to lactoylglutathione lyase
MTEEIDVLSRKDYPAGVPCWIDVVQSDVDATRDFYGALFAWTFETRTPEGAPQSYAYAKRDGLIVGGIGGPPTEDEVTEWTHFVRVDSADDTAAAVTENGGKVLVGPYDVGPAGRVATCADPEGAVFGLWQAGSTRGVELVNADGSWNFSELHTNDTQAAAQFYRAVFGWNLNPFEFGGGPLAGFFSVDGYGQFLADADPEIKERQAGAEAPDGFWDAVAIAQQIEAGSGEQPHWSQTFAVADADGAFARAIELGATEVVPLFDTPYTRQGMVRDPQGSAFTLSEYRPPAGD